MTTTPTPELAKLVATLETAMRDLFIADRHWSEEVARVYNLTTPLVALVNVGYVTAVSEDGLYNLHEHLNVARILLRHAAAMDWWYVAAPQALSRAVDEWESSHTSLDCTICIAQRAS